MRFLLLRRRRLACCLLAALGLAGCATPPPPAAANVYNIRDFGATGDGKTLDTDAINKAIAAAAAAGGGTVEFPAGTYLSFSIRLQEPHHAALGPGLRDRGGDRGARIRQLR